MTQPPMNAEVEAEPGGGTIWRWLGLFAAGLATVTMFGMIAGFSAASLEQGWSRFTLLDGAILSVIVAVTAGLGWLTWRLGRKLFGQNGHVPRRERRSRNFLLASGAIGVVIGILLAGTDFMTGGGDPFAVLSSRPLPPTFAIAMAVFLIVFLPALSWQWQKAIDEHERQAYFAGAVVAAYVYMIIAPAWWFLWRGGLVPAPDGIILYFAFNLTFLIVWFWKKYR
jgi:uncharacterized membrane protein YozB (DUF420 family)